MIRYLALVTLLPLVVCAQEVDECQDQAKHIVERLQAEVTGPFDAAQHSAATDIVVDICRYREEEQQAEVEQAVQQAREERGADGNGWFNSDGDKAGNKRLQRRGSY